MKYDVKSWDSKKVGSIELADAVFGLPERTDILHQVVRGVAATRLKASVISEEPQRSLGGKREPVERVLEA